MSGLSAEVWDDSLARIPVGQGLRAFTSSILAAGSLIAILSSSRNVFLYESSDFVESSASPIQLGEHVDRMQLNCTGTLLKFTCTPPVVIVLVHGVTDKTRMGINN